MTHTPYDPMQPLTPRPDWQNPAPAFSPLEQRDPNAYVTPQGAAPFPWEAPAPAPAFIPPEAARLPRAASIAGSGPITDIAEIPSLDDVRLRNYSELDSKLTVHNPDPRLEYRWVNDDPHSVTTRFAQGYRPVTRSDAATSEDGKSIPPWLRGPNAQNEVRGNATPMLQAGSRADGAGRRAILMARPVQFRQLQDANFRRMVGERNQALDPRSAPAPVAKDGSSAGLETNSLSSSDRSSFRGEIRIAGTA